jgi:hypothetical protein
MYNILSQVERGANLAGYAAFISECLVKDESRKAFISYDDLLTSLIDYVQTTGDPILYRLCNGQKIRISNNLLSKFIKPHALQVFEAYLEEDRVTKDGDYPGNKGRPYGIKGIAKVIL